MRVLVECYPDAAVLRALGVTKKQLLHERCKGEVVKRVRKLDCAIGVIDEDPRSAQPRDLNNYDEEEAAGGLRLLVRHGSADRKLIVVCPRLEDWLIARAVSSGIRLQDYGLPGDPHRLHGIPHYEDRQTFQQFLTELTGRDAEGMGLLRQWVQQAK
jgi:hypothetical protein